MGFVTMNHMNSLFKTVIVALAFIFTASFSAAQEQKITVFFTGHIVADLMQQMRKNVFCVFIVYIS